VNATAATNAAMAALRVIELWWVIDAVVMVCPPGPHAGRFRLMTPTFGLRPPSAHREDS
jgi:hypothetical protein